MRFSRNAALPSRAPGSWNAEADAYAIALEVMAAASQLPGAREGMAAFLEKRKPSWPD